MTHSRMALLGMAAAVSAAAVTAQGAIVVQPTDSAQTSNYNARLAVHMVNGDGLSDATIVETGDSLPAVWPSHVTGPAPYVRWQSSGGVVNEAVAFDLGAYYDLTAMHIWNMNDTSPEGPTSRGVQNATVYVLSNFVLGQNGIQDFPVASLPGAGGIAITIPQASGLTTYAGVDIALPLANVRYLALKVDSNWGSTQGYVALDEVRFVGTPVPEPASLGVLALGGLALLRRRRQAF